MGYGRLHGLGYGAGGMALRQFILDQHKKGELQKMRNQARAQQGLPAVGVDKPQPTILPAPVPKRGPFRTPERSTPLRVPDDFIGHDPAITSRYTQEQIREMLERGASETVERSGEADGGGPADFDLMQQSREADATETFDAGTGTGFTTSGKEVKDFLPLGIAVAGALYFLL